MKKSNDLITLTSKGLYCPPADCYIDPWSKVKRAIVTHGHSDHARSGSGLYICHKDSVGILKYRLGPETKVQALEYGKNLRVNGVKISLYPAGHVLGSSQVRIERKGEVWGISGDFKTDADPTCQSLESFECHTFVTESTFGLPVFNWPDTSSTFNEINHWWSQNRENGKTSVLMGYSLGKAQRLLSQLDTSLGSIFCHGAIQNMNQVYRDSGVPLPQTTQVDDSISKQTFRGNLVLAPPSAMSSPWLRRFPDPVLGLASGWMALRGTRRRRNVDRGFVLSDHADWSGLNQVIESTGADRVLVTHGYSEIFASWLNSTGRSAEVLPTRFEGELAEIGESSNQES